MSDDEYNEAESNSLLLIIETLTGIVFEMEVPSSFTVLETKKKIQRLEGIPVHHQNLLFRLKELEDSSRLADVGIVNRSRLKLVLSMRGGPIYTRRLTSCDHHLLLKDLKDLIEHTREELGNKLSSGAKVSLLVFKDGDVINLIRVIEHADGTYHPYNDKSPSPTKVIRDEGQTGYYRKLQENNCMLAKLTELRKRMADLALKRHFKNSKPVEADEASSVGCIGQKTRDLLNIPKFNTGFRIHSLRQFRKDAENLLKLHESQFADELDDSSNDDPLLRTQLLHQFRKDAENLLKLHESQFDDDEDDETDSDDLVNDVQVCEESIALKEKHRGKNSFYNILFQDPNLKLRPEKPFTFTKLKPGESFKSTSSSLQNNQIKDQSLTVDNVLGMPSTAEDKIINSSVLSPLYQCFNSNSRNHKFDAKINLPDMACDLNISTPTSASSLAESIALLDEDTENDAKELISPIGVPCAGTVSMSKVSARNSVCLKPLLLQDTGERSKTSPETVKLEESSPEYCDIFPGDGSENYRSNKLGLLKRWQSVDCSSEESCNPSSSSTTDFEVMDRNCYGPSLFPSASRKFPAHYAPNLYLGVNEERISRSPLYRRFSQTGNCVTKADSVSKTNDNHTHTRNLNDLNATWDTYSSSDAGSSTIRTNSNCDNVLNIQPLPGTLYNLINGRTPNTDTRVDLNPLRFKNDCDSKKLVDEIKNLCATGDVERCKSGVGKIHVDATKLENLPSIISKKRMRCGMCNKRLNITNMYDCRCGGMYCAHHRYSEVHSCHYDYKSEGRKLLEQQNPVVIADKINKL